MEPSERAHVGGVSPEHTEGASNDEGVGGGGIGSGSGQQEAVLGAGTGGDTTEEGGKGNGFVGVTESGGARKGFVDVSEAAEERKGLVEDFPRLTYKAKPGARRCSVCRTKTAAKMTLGHPLSDQASEGMNACVSCFERIPFIFSITFFHFLFRLLACMLSLMLLVLRASPFNFSKRFSVSFLSLC